MVTPEDEKFYRWLTEILAIAQKYKYDALQVLPSIEVSDKYIEVWVGNALLAADIWETQFLLSQLTSKGLKVYVGEKLLGLVPPLAHKQVSTQTMIERINQNPTLTNSKWVQQNRGCLDFMASKGTTSIHSTDSDRGYPAITILPFLGLEEVLCKPINELLGKPAVVATGVIGATKKRCIEEVLRTKQNVTLSYEMLWERRLWKKTITGIYLSDGEVMLVTEDTDSWQTDFWRSLVS